MSSKKMMCVAALSLIASPLSANAKSPEAFDLKPVGPWRLDHSKDSCNLERVFADDKNNEILLRLDRFGPHEPFYVIVLGQSTATQDVFVAATMQFLPGGAPTIRKTSFTGHTELGGKTVPLVILGRVSLQGDEASQGGRSTDPAPDQIASMNAVSLALSRPRRTMMFHMESLGPIMAEMNKCTADLVTHWGLNPAEQATFTSPSPKQSPGNWIRSGDYPTSALRQGNNGLVHFRLMIDKTGHVSDCVVQDIAPPEDFSRITCAALIRRARFWPAIDSDGVPHASYWIRTVSYVVPTD